MRRLFAMLLLVVAGGTQAQTFETATPEQLASRRCWEKTALVLIGSNRPGPGTGGDSGDFPWGFRPELVPTYFGAGEGIPYFAKRFASFANGKWQRDLSTQKEQNAPYLIARHVIAKGLPWRDVFVGRYDLDFYEGRGTVVESPTGLGYFRVTPWVRQYAGNEMAGYKLSTAYRMLNNTLGVKLTAAANNTAGDASATGRQAPGCTGCHFNGSFPLDKIARVLDRRQGFGESMTFVPSTDGPQEIWGQTFTDDESLIRFFIASPSFTFNTCRMAFEFLHGRPESTCDAPVFDACVTAFEAEGTIQAAILGMIKHPDYCR